MASYHIIANFLEIDDMHLYVHNYMIDLSLVTFIHNAKMTK